MTAASSPARVHRLQVDDVHVGSELVIDQSDPGRSVVKRLHAPRAPVGHGSFSILIRYETLNSPDQVAILSSRVHARRVEAEIELRTYAGPLFANLRSVAVLEIGPLEIASGSAEVVLTVHRFSFDTVDHPEVATAGPTSTRIFSFIAP